MTNPFDDSVIRHNLKRVEDTITIRIKEEYQALIRPQTEKEFNSLKYSIQRNGQRDPIIVNSQGYILDGHHRYKICQDLGLKPKKEIRDFQDESDVIAFIYDTNLKHGRHFSDFERVELSSQIESLREKAKRNTEAKLPEKGQKGFQPVISKNLEIIGTDHGILDKLAKQSGLSHETVRKALIIKDRAPEELKAQVRSNNIKIDKAFKEIRKTEQREKLVQEALDNNLIELPEGIKLIHGDFIEKSKEIPDESIDLIFTDPLYDKEHLYLYGELAKVAERVLKKGGSLLTIVGHYAMHRVFNLIEDNSTELKFHWPLVILHTGQTRAQYGPKVFVAYKPLFWYVKKDRSNAPDEYLVDVILSEPPDKTGNDYAQSPVEAKEVISKLTVEGQTVFDPFMGYATTGIPAMNLKRKFIGIEIDEEHFKTAQLRIAKEPPTY